MIITLISDLGINNPYHGMGEAIIHQHFPDARIIYISHQIQPFSILQSSYLWKCTSGNYPPGTFHIGLVDIFQNFPAHIMHTQHGDSHYIGIDNGLITASFDQSIHNSYISKNVVSNYKEYIAQCCVDIQHILNSRYSEHHFIPHAPLKIYQFPEVVVQEAAIICMVIFIDRFENIITNLSQAEFEKYLAGRNYNIQMKGKEVIHNISEKYSHSESGGLSAYFNDFGYLQISMKARGARTASSLGYMDFEVESLINTNITINIEN